MVEEVTVERRGGKKRLQRPKSASYIAVRSALFQLTSLGDFTTEKIGAGFYADVYKVTNYVAKTGELSC